MTTLLQEGCLDWFAHEELSPTQMKNVYIYVEGEYGFIPLIVGKSMEESKPLIASIMSRYQNVESFNRMPKPNDPSWRVTAVKDDTIFIAITNWFPHSDGRGEPSPTLWKNSYLLVRDLVMFLIRNGTKELTFLTSMNIIDGDREPQLLQASTLENNPHLDEEMYLALPAWSFVFTARLAGLHADVLCITQDEGQFIDPTALGLAISHFVMLGYDFDMGVMDSTIQTLKSLEDDIGAQAFDEDSSMGEWA